jgi:uncharacterized protein (DUF2249 family)
MLFDSRLDPNQGVGGLARYPLAMMNHQTVVVDVRADIKSGGSPCSRILDSAEQLGEGDTLQLIAPFEPTPLYDVLGREGFVHESRELGNGDWEVRFTRKPKPVAPSGVPSVDESRDGCGCAAATGELLEVDARGLEPPQPMVRILDALATLPEGASLRAFTDRQPMHLLDQLALRGFRGESQENPEGGYVTLIHRH